MTMQMRYRNRVWSIVVAFVLLLTPLSANAEDVKFRWAFGAMTGSGGTRQFVRVNHDVTVRRGDEVQLFLSPVTACFIYLLHEDSAGKMSVLFPDPANTFPRNYGPGRDFYIPDAATWLSVDAAIGTERIYLVASAKRLTNLESLLGRRSGAAGAIVRDDVITELARLMKQHAAKWSERPPAMAGQIRGDHPDLAHHATEIVAEGFFSRVFVIDHR